MSRILKFDWIIITCVALLIGVSLAVLYSISTSGGADPQSLGIFWKQCMFVLIGLGALIFFTFTNHQYLKSNSTLLYFVTLFFLALVLVIGVAVRGTVGWIGVGGFHIQPVEMAKLALIIFLASFISQKKMELSEGGRFVASLVLTGIMIFLVARQPDFGSAIVLAGIWIGMTLVSGISKKLFVIIMIAGLGAALIGWVNLVPYQKDRIMNLVRPSADLRGSGYNVNQSIIAVGSGGLVGKGIGHGSQSHLNFLPEKHTDFIFASIAEELGLIGAVFVLILYGIIFYRIKVIAQLASDNFGYLLAVGTLVMLFVQVLENIGMNIGVMPVTGIPLPLLSYGGSSLITVLASIGVLMSVYSKKENRIHSEEEQ